MFVRLEGVVDFEAERQRLRKEIERRRARRSHSWRASSAGRVRGARAPPRWWSGSASDSSSSARSSRITTSLRPRLEPPPCSLRSTRSTPPTPRNPRSSAWPRPAPPKARGHRAAPAGGPRPARDDWWDAPGESLLASVLLAPAGWPMTTAPQLSRSAASRWPTRSPRRPGVPRGSGLAQRSARGRPEGGAASSPRRRPWRGRRRRPRPSRESWASASSRADRFPAALADRATSLRLVTAAPSTATRSWQR